jgi:hypothetical protein
MDTLKIKAAVWYLAVVWASLLLLSGGTVSAGFFEPVSKVAAAAVILMFAFDRWIWRWRLLHGWFVKRPNLHGTWVTELTSSWVDPVSGERVPPTVGYLVVRQTFSRLSMRLLTEKSASRLRGAEIATDGDGLYEVTAVYSNDPKFVTRDGNPGHNGAFILSVRGNPPAAMEGHYWTDRSTHGGMRADNRVPRVFDSVEEARAAYSRDGRQTGPAVQSAQNAAKG